MTRSDVRAAQDATPDRRWRILVDDGEWLGDPWPAIGSAKVVIAWAGQNSVADLAVAGARAVVIPQPRPFREQVVTGEALTAAGLALVQPTWPAAESWGPLLDRAESSTPDWYRWRTDGAAGRAADAILTVARRWPR
ncbi:hypothetical protein GCM10025867_31150 [Frondihabitans sucicola]|uniref:Glycosyl transferase family 28 C-terminal domain-containing protein n=1 Tax=Frondihabitans sucicola TaxID=1268041 RepID=A0ABM8GR20_9MICO|nr:glycosyltransferase [Frondihabitans sucicola]BDZ50874.1 hypothetical protein GCM10025867_31150 [Frondihabitans sucicola]